MNICENCKNEHDGTYGLKWSKKKISRFCSQKCARSFSTKTDNKKEEKEIVCIKCRSVETRNKRVSEKEYLCKNCKKPECCEYGCDQEPKFLLKNKKWCCSEYPCQCSEIKKRTSLGIKKAHKEGRIKTDHLVSCRAWSRRKLLLPEEDVFCRNSRDSESIKKYLLGLNKVEYKCSECGLDSWNEKKIVLDLDHIDGDRFNNNLYNLRLLCPNCHSQTETYKGRGLSKGHRSWSDKELTEAIKSSNNIRQVCFCLKISPKGDSYKTIRHNMERLNLIFEK